MDFIKTHSLKSVLVKYDKEILPEATVKSFYEIRETENGVQTLHQLESDDQNVATYLLSGKLNKNPCIFIGNRVQYLLV